METKLMEDLLEQTIAFSKTSYELAKLKTLGKVSDLASSLIPYSIVLFFIVVFLLFVNLGLAFWLGDILGRIYYGFFAVAGFYLIAGLCTHYFMHKCIKKRICNAIIKKLLT